MKRPRRRNGFSPAKVRMGFSLVEILVVMGLIAVLSAALIVVLPRVSNAAKLAATRATIRKVDELLNDRMNAFKRYILTQDRLAGAGTPSYVISQNTLAQSGGSLALAKILAIKQLFRQSFPQSFADMTTPPGYTTSAHSKNTESAACLYIILTQQAVFDTEPPAAADLRAIEVTDTDKDGLPEIVDAWGQPLRFYRWPTRLIRVATTPTTQQSITTATYGIQINPQWTVTCSGQTSPVTTQALISSVNVPAPATLTLLQEQNTTNVQNLAKDPDDPSGLIQTAMTQTSPPALFTPASFESSYHTPDTYFTPLILSAGPAEQGVDGDLLGLFEPWDTANYGNLAQPVITSTNPQALTAVFGYITNQQR